MDDVIYLLVPAEEGPEAERLGAHWDPVHLRWFILGDQDPEPFLDWLPIDDLEGEDVPELCIAAPIYVVETSAICRSCGSDSPVITLAAEKFAPEDDGHEYLLGKASDAQPDPGGEPAGKTFGGDVFEEDEDEEGYDEESQYQHENGLMRFQFIKELPGEVVSLLGRRYPFFRKRVSNLGGDGSYFINQCSRCGEPFEDLFLHSEPGVGFYLFSRQDAEKVVLRELPIDGSMLIQANFGLVVPDVILQFSPRTSFPADS